MRQTVALLFCLSSILLADGGALLFQKQSGPLMISVFVSPAPVTSGPADVSVMVQNAADHSIIDDARVKLRLTKSEVEIDGVATRGQAANKLLYAAQVNLPPGMDGDWRVNVQVTTPETSIETNGVLRVAPAPAPLIAYWPYFAAVPLVIGLFVLNRWLKSTGRSSRSVS